MLNLEGEDIDDENWWKQYRKEIEECKQQMYGKTNWTPWGHVDELKRDPDFVRRLFDDEKVSIDFLKKLGIMYKNKKAK